MGKRPKILMKRYPASMNNDLMVKILAASAVDSERR
jgi:hypothetical protein